MLSENILITNISGTSKKVFNKQMFVPILGHSENAFFLVLFFSRMV